MRGGWHDRLCRIYPCTVAFFPGPVVASGLFWYGDPVEQGSYISRFYVWILLRYETQLEARALLGEGFVSTMIPESPQELHDYWRQMLSDFPGHHLHSKPNQWRWTIPVAIWGDEGGFNRRSWMLASWKLGFVKFLSPCMGCISCIYTFWVPTIILGLGFPFSRSDKNSGPLQISN